MVNPFDNLTSLREAVAYANAHPGPDTIVFDPTALGKRPRTIRLIGGPLVLTDPATTTIIGPGARKLTIQGKGKSLIFDIEGGIVGALRSDHHQRQSRQGNRGARSQRRWHAPAEARHHPRQPVLASGGRLFNNGGTPRSPTSSSAARPRL